MHDVSPDRMSNALERDLARLADGTLEPAKRERIEQLVADSADLQTRLGEQRQAIAAARSVAQRERAPIALRVRRRSATARKRRSPPVFGLGVLGAVGAVVWTLAALGGTQAELTMASAATLSARPSTMPVSEPPHDEGVTLPALRVAGIPFPYWEDHFNWRAAGARDDRIAGRFMTTVLYRRAGWLVGYTIVPGRPLPAPRDARSIVRAGTVLTTFSTGGRRVVTWLRRGHTCVLSARDVPIAAMLKLAVWRGRGQIPF